MTTASPAEAFACLPHLASGSSCFSRDSGSSASGHHRAGGLLRASPRPASSFDDWRDITMTAEGAVS